MPLFAQLSMGKTSEMMGASIMLPMAVRSSHIDSIVGDSDSGSRGGGTGSATTGIEGGRGGGATPASAVEVLFCGVCLCRLCWDKSRIASWTPSAVGTNGTSGAAGRGGGGWCAAAERPRRRASSVASSGESSGTNMGLGDNGAKLSVTKSTYLKKCITVGDAPVQ